MKYYLVSLKYKVVKTTTELILVQSADALLAAALVLDEEYSGHIEASSITAIREANVIEVFKNTATLEDRELDDYDFYEVKLEMYDLDGSIIKESYLIESTSTLKAEEELKGYLQTAITVTSNKKTQISKYIRK